MGSLVMPDSVTDVEKMLLGCEKLENVKLSNSLKEISSGMFETCRKLKR